MSYLDLTRLNFKGFFQADVSSINNTIQNYDITTFDPTVSPLAWNPVGTGSFRLLDCRISGGAIDGVAVTVADPGLGVTLENAAMRVAGKLVDLDPQQQMVSQIWGMKVRLAIGENLTVFNGEYLPAAFTNVWGRQQNTQPNDQSAGAVYQSILHDVSWLELGNSALLKAVRDTSPTGCLSINMNVYGYSYDDTNDNPRFTMGQVVGSIGPYYPDEPKHFVVGRQMLPNKGSTFNDFTCVLHENRHKISVDLGNALMLIDATEGLLAKGDLILAAYKVKEHGRHKSVTPEQIEIIGVITEAEYTAPEWYGRTAAIVDFDYAANPWLVANIGSHSLLLLGPHIGPQHNLSYPVHVQESLGGLYVRADNFVIRLNPGQSAPIDLYASQYGKPLSNAAIKVGIDPHLLRADTGQPATSTPLNAIEMPNNVSTDAHGKASFFITASSAGPGNPRAYIDGQVYGIGYGLATLPRHYVSNHLNFISLLAFDAMPIPDAPTWYQDIQPILKQYANLYPIMSKYLVNLAEYTSVIGHLPILTLAFSLPIENPNHMPVTRDLSEHKRSMILKWMNNRGPDGLPLLGMPPLPETASTAVTPVLPATVPSTPLEHDDIGKTGLMKKIIERHNAARDIA
ncbi:hypothetical protein AAKU55_001598 [Oxalobacteraceae bacterium GrIS 1.11]